MNRTYTEAEYVELYVDGKAPDAPMCIVQWVWDAMPKDVRDKVLTQQNVVLFDRETLGTSTSLGYKGEK